MLFATKTISASVLGASTAVISAKYWSNLGQVLRRIPPKALLQPRKPHNKLAYNDTESAAVHIHEEAHPPYIQSHDPSPRQSRPQSTTYNPR